MKLSSSLAAVLVAIATSLATPLVHAHADHGKPQYGGIYGEAGTFQLELVPGENALTFYATVHGEPVSTQGASGKVTIMEADGKSSTATLSPAGSNQLVAPVKGKPAAGSKIVASVTLAGKQPANIRYAIPQ